MTWYCRSNPPQLLTSATPLTICSRGLIIQSWMARNSVRSRVRLLMM